MTATRNRLTFSERHPTSIKIEKVVGGALATFTIYLTVAKVFLGNFMPTIFEVAQASLFWCWIVYFAYRFLKRFTTTITVDGNRVTVSRGSIVPLLRSEHTYTLGTGTIVEMEPTRGWWIPKEIFFMDGDDPQWFTDIAITTYTASGRFQRILLSRDRAPKDVMIGRREDIEAMLHGLVETATA